MKTYMHRGTAHTLIAEQRTNSGRLAVSLDGGVLTKWVALGGGELLPVASGPASEQGKMGEDDIREAANHNGAWWEDHKAQLMAMAVVSLSPEKMRHLTEQPNNEQQEEK